MDKTIQSLADKLASLAEKIAQPAWDLAIEAARLEAVSTASSLIITTVVGLLVIKRLSGTVKLIPNDSDEIILPMVVIVVISLVVLIVMVNIPPYVYGIFRPDVFLAWDVFF